MTDPVKIIGIDVEDLCGNPQVLLDLMESPSDRIAITKGRVPVGILITIEEFMLMGQVEHGQGFDAQIEPLVLKAQRTVAAVSPPVCHPVAASGPVPPVEAKASPRPKRALPIVRVAEKRAEYRDRILDLYHGQHLTGPQVAKQLLIPLDWVYKTLTDSGTKHHWGAVKSKKIKTPAVPPEVESRIVDLLPTTQDKDLAKTYGVGLRLVRQIRAKHKIDHPVAKPAKTDPDGLSPERLSRMMMLSRDWKAGVKLSVLAPRYGHKGQWGEAAMEIEVTRLRRSYPGLFPVRGASQG